ncbi:hypothetical protein JTE90_003412 [Oedothorax gibbosus]|uniref:Exonuclease domain-containing protein n=1 Tax=Oedothorax gibbosus TaxID=931172 RepID=A0AAV6TYF2_9ARAC|nr:hypothetical protein JTE90_003412 [Oedothorax gibbosus]
MYNPRTLFECTICKHLKQEVGMAPLKEIILDTETTGIDPKQGHRIIEIGAIEMIDKRMTGKVFHVYVNPQRDVTPQAYRVHGISRDFLKSKPLFANIVHEFLTFVGNSPMVMHNALSFDFQVSESTNSRY